MTQGLTFYKNFDGDTIYSLQVHQKRHMCPTCDNTFIALADYIHPFIFTRVASSENINTFKIKDTNDDTIATLDNTLVDIINAGDVDFIYSTFQLSGETLNCDLYYYEIETDNELYYSDIFRVVSKDLAVQTTDLAVNGSFTSDLSGWTVSGASWSSGSALIEENEWIKQTTLGESFVKVIVTTTQVNSDCYFRFGGVSLPIALGTNNFFMPSGMEFTIINTNSGVASDLIVSQVQVYEVEKVECYNLIVARNSCNKTYPYQNTGYTNLFIFDAELSEPEYIRDDEFDENGNKEKTQTFLKISKKWSLLGSFPLYEPFVDELQKLPFYDTIYIYNDIWKKEFKAYQSTLDLEIDAEWLFAEKCNASVNIVINETLALSNSCCDDTTVYGCCDEFGWNINTDVLSAVVLTLEELFCIDGTIYYLDQYSSGGTLLGSIEFEDTITFDSTIGVGLTWNVRGSKFGCPDIEYPLNVS